MDKHKNLEISMKLFEWAETERLGKAFRWIEKEFQYENFVKYNADVTGKLRSVITHSTWRHTLKK